MHDYKAPLRDQLTPRRLTIAMWDFAYLLRRNTGEGYEDWDERLDELVDRGYNTVRIDAFPDLILASQNGHEAFSFPSLNRPWFMWDNNAPTTVRPAEQVPQFVGKAAKHGLKVILSTWWWGGKINIWARSPQEITEAWKATLRLMDREGLADDILYVDITNEAHLPLSDLEPESEGWAPGEPRRWTLTEAKRRWIGKTCDGILSSLQAEFPHYRSTMSFTGGNPDEVGRLCLQHADVLEYHLFTEDPRFLVRTRFNEELSPAIRALPPYADYDEKAFTEMCRQFTRRADTTMALVGPMMAKWMWQKIQRIMEVGEQWCVPVTNTESGAQWFMTEHAGQGWGWFRQWCEALVEMSGEAGFWGTTTCNCAGPQFTQLWADKQWHRELNQRFLES